MTSRQSSPKILNINKRVFINVFINVFMSAFGGVLKLESKKNQLSKPYFVAIIVLLLGGLLQSAPAFGFAAKGSEELLQQKIKNLIKKMTLAEKVGQMTQVTLDVVSKNEEGKLHELDPKKLHEALEVYHVGSILNVDSTPSGANAAFSIEKWHEVITTIEDEALKTRLKIPVIYGIDSIHGAHYTQGATIFPQSLNIAATWDAKWSKIQGEITALETRASGIPWNFFPVLDVGRQPLWPRFYETYGEDVFLARKMGQANVLGQQGSELSAASHKNAVCLKHYVGYSHPQSGNDRTPAIITERMMREYYLPTFADAIKAGAETVMVNSGEVDGIPGHANYHLLTEVLRGEFKFKGFTVSDWRDIIRLYDTDHIASSPKQAVQIAVLAGVDMSMTPYDFKFYDLLIELVNEGKVPVKRIDEAVSRILRVKLKLGLFENPYPDKNLKTEFATEKSRQANVEMAQNSITLLKNDKEVLPLKKNTRLLLTGPACQSLAALNGGWTITWQGDREEFYPKNKKTIYQAIQEKVPAKNIEITQGSQFETGALDLQKTLELANKVDAIVLCLGEKPYAEFPGNIKDLNLSDSQIELGEKLIKTGKPVILILTEGRPRVVRRLIGAQGVLMAYLPGMEGGLAIADALFGDINPSGKLPFSYPQYANSVVPYDYKSRENLDGNKYDPQWPFGFGLSYTKFQYRDLQLSTLKLGPGKNMEVSVEVKNTGSRAGQEVVQLYLSDIYRSAVTPPNKQLKGFQKINLVPGESQRVRFTITPDELSFIDQSNHRVVEAGDFNVQIRELNQKFELLEHD